MSRLPTPTEVDAAWASALDLWGVRLRPPVIGDGRSHGAFAWFSFPPQVHVDPAMLASAGGGEHLVSVLAHEIGHHVLSPSTRIDALKIHHQLGRVLQVVDTEGVLALDRVVAHLANLWSDLLINVRVAHLQGLRAPDVEPDMIALWRALQSAPRGRAVRRGRERAMPGSWWVLMRAYEVLWSLPADTLCPLRSPAMTDAALHPEADAALLAQTARTFGRDPVAGALPFGMVLAPYLVAAAAADGSQQLPSGVCRNADERPPTAAELAEVLADARVEVAPRHPALGASEASHEADADALDAAAQDAPAADGGQAYDLSRTLALYPTVPRSTVLTAWYERRARPLVRPLQQLLPQRPVDDLLGPWEQWEPGDDLADIDWPATVRGGPVVPGVTTLRRAHLEDDVAPRRASIDLDLYLDSSGSMRSPERASPGVLAAFVLAAGVLRGGGRVRAASFSGAGEVAGSEGWSRDREAIADVLLTFFAGGTSFPLDLLARRYLDAGGEQALRAAGVVRRHLVVISDDGLSSMFGVGHEADPSLADVAARVRPRLDTASLLLVGFSPRAGVGEEAEAAGYDVLYVPEIDAVPQAAARLGEVLSTPSATPATPRRRPA